MSNLKHRCLFHNYQFPTVTAQNDETREYALSAVFLSMSSYWMVSGSFLFIFFLVPF